MSNFHGQQPQKGRLPATYVSGAIQKLHHHRVERTERFVILQMGQTKDILIIGLLLNHPMLCKPKKTLYQS